MINQLGPGAGRGGGGGSWRGRGCAMILLQHWHVSLHTHTHTHTLTHSHTHTACTCTLHAGIHQAYLHFTSVFPATCVTSSPLNLPGQQPDCGHGHRGTHAHTCVPVCPYRKTAMSPAFTSPNKLPHPPSPPVSSSRCGCACDWCVSGWPDPPPICTHRVRLLSGGWTPSCRSLNLGRDSGWLTVEAPLPLNSGQS